MERTETSTHVLGNGHANGHAPGPLKLAAAVCVSCGTVEYVPAPEPPGHLCAACEAEQE